ncbi:redox-regulated ATPase YchF [Patescibacteria group bacterium]|nr:redox-regulated ATPase YchF [Patescibacteria group bacterium]
MSFSVGIIGLPNVGKSTLFKALTKKQVDISNYPFCTIKSNVGLVKIPDQRLDKLAEILKPKQVLPTYIEFVDIAGLVKGAHQGEGLGNQFLARIREVEAMAEVVRSFSDPNVAHVAGQIDPLSDIETIKLELVFADLATVENRLIKTEKQAKSGEQEAAKLTEVLEKIKRGLDKNQTVAEINLAEEEMLLIKDLHFLTSKPIVYIMNIDEKEIANHMESISNNREYKNQVPVCAKLEAELADLKEQEVKEYLKEYGLKKSGLENLIISTYKLLDLITFFTCQNQILQAWTLPQKSTALQAANKIHADFAQGFIRAEVVNWQDLVKQASEQKAREAGLMRTEGKNYLVQDGDVIHFKFQV